VHGSLKANHILLPRLKDHETVKLIDLAQAQPPGRTRQFGAPELIDLFQTVGHPSPEELRGETIDQRADIYALGCMLYKILTGKAPFNGSSAEEIKQKHIEEAPPSLLSAFPQVSFPMQLEECVKRMLAKKPEDRHQSADDLALDLRFAARRSG
jgi:serine/threonine-protein kinase